MDALFNVILGVRARMFSWCCISLLDLDGTPKILLWIPIDLMERPPLTPMTGPATIRLLVPRAPTGNHWWRRAIRQQDRLSPCTDSKVAGGQLSSARPRR